MTGLIQLVQRWLWPAAAETSTDAQDTTSMADLARLLASEPEPSGAVDGQGEGQANGADRSGP